MVYEVTLIYGQECNITKHVITDVTEIQLVEGSYLFLDCDGRVKAMFTNNAVLSVLLKSLG